MLKSRVGSDFYLCHVYMYFGIIIIHLIFRKTRTRSLMTQRRWKRRYQDDLLLLSGLFLASFSSLGLGARG
jgi:hypothetical protein